MDCGEGRFSAPVAEPDTMVDDSWCANVSLDECDLIKNAIAITGLSSSGPAIEGPSGDLQYQGLEAMAPLVSEGYPQDLNNWLLSDNESWKVGLSPSAQDPDNVLQTYFDLYQPEPYQVQNCRDPLNSQSPCSAPGLNIRSAFKGKPNEVWSERGHVFQSFQFPVETRVPCDVEGNRQEQEPSSSFSTCKICLAYSASDPIETPCGHVFCKSCLSEWLEDGAKPCPECSTPLIMDANVTSYAESSVEWSKVREFEYDMINQQGHQHAMAPSPNLDTVQRETHGLNIATRQGLPREYQQVHLDVWQPLSGHRSHPFHGLVPNEVLAESRPSVDVDSEHQTSGKRGREKTLPVVDHNGVAMRFDGLVERFTAYYRPSYWTEDDSAVLLGEYPTFEEAKDAHNLVTLLHEGPHAQMDLAPFTADKYAEELKRWEGKHHVDVVCELRLRGRGFLKNGSVNYKHVGRRRSKTSVGMTRTRYFSTVLNEPIQSSNARTSKPMRAIVQTFDTPEEAARCADQALVKQRGVDAWTNFPLSSYITSEDELPLTFLPLSNNFRENLDYKRARNF